MHSEAHVYTCVCVGGWVGGSVGVCVCMGGCVGAWGGGACMACLHCFSVCGALTSDMSAVTSATVCARNDTLSVEVAVVVVGITTTNNNTSSGDRHRSIALALVLAITIAIAARRRGRLGREFYEAAAVEAPCV